MKNIAWLLFSFLSVANTQAQKVAFSFQLANAVRNICPACLNDFNELTPVGDTLTSLDLRGYELKNLEGIQNFRSLKYLNCANNKLTKISALPESLEILYCFRNELVSLPALPERLKLLYANDNQLANLPALPESVEVLDCSNNQIKELPNLPARLQKLDFMHNPISLEKLPLLPDSLTSLRCPISVHNHLQKTYPHLLKPLDDEKYVLLDAALAADIRKHCKNCVSEDNYLLSFKIFTTKYGALTLTNPQIRNLSSLQRMEIEHLKIEIPNLEFLDVLPRGLVSLDCSNMQLTKLPVLPNTLIYLNCANNKIKVLPPLPQYIQFLNCTNNQIEVFPNIASKSELRHFFIGKNKLKKIYLPANTEKGLIRIEKFNVSFNELEEIKISKFGYVGFFDCSNNKIKKIYIEGANEFDFLDATINHFDCSYNQIDTLHWSLFISVDKINCSHNNISSLDISAESIGELDCSFNNIKDIPRNLVQSVQKKLVYDNNPIPEDKKQKIDERFSIVHQRYEKQREKQARRNNRGGGGGGGLKLMDFLWMGGR
jgi:Leucine-rich repeat (LRR) protein